MFFFSVIQLLIEMGPDPECSDPFQVGASGPSEIIGTCKITIILLGRRGGDLV